VSPPRRLSHRPTLPVRQVDLAEQPSQREACRLSGSRPRSPWLSGHRETSEHWGSFGSSHQQRDHFQFVFVGQADSERPRLARSAAARSLFVFTAAARTLQRA
jgi:hypothetical protein